MGVGYQENTPEGERAGEEMYYKRLTDRNWRAQKKQNEIYERLAMLEDGIDRKEIAFVGDLQKTLNKWVSEATAFTQREKDIMQWVLEEIRS